MKKLILCVVALLLALVVVTGDAAAAAAKPIKIGVIMPYTGVGAYPAEQNRLGFKMALEEYGYKAAGREIRVFYEDDEGSPPVAATKARKLVEKEKVHMLYGPWNDHTGLAVESYIKPLGLPFACPMAGALVRTVDYPSALNFCYTEENITAPFAKYAYEKLGYRRAILVASDYAWGHSCVEAYAEAFRRAGGTVVDKIYIPLGTMDMAPYIDKMKAHGAKADFMWDFVIVTDGVRLHRHFFEAGLHKTIHRFPSSDIFSTTLIDDVGPDAAVGVLCGYQWLPEIAFSTSKKFVQEFEKKYPGKAADWFSACGYQGAKIIVTALKAIGGKSEDKKAFLGALIGVKVPAENNIYTDGVLTFDPTYRAAILDMYIAKVVEVDGKPKRQVIDVLKGVRPMVLPGFMYK